MEIRPIIAEVKTDAKSARCLNKRSGFFNKRDRFVNKRGGS